MNEIDKTSFVVGKPRSRQRFDPSSTFGLIRRIGWVTLGVIALVVTWDVLTYDAGAWQADYSLLKRDMARGYANLDWMVEHRKVDLAAIDDETTTAIDRAHSRVRAFLAIRRFIRGFNDPHLRLVLGERPLGGPPSLITAESIARNASSTNTESVEQPADGGCDGCGYEEGNHAFGFPFERTPGFRAVRGGNFPTAMLSDTGVLRIAQFGEDQYLSACEEVYRTGIGQRALKLKVRALLQEDLRAAIASLQMHGARRLLVDVTGNGGGTEWVREVVALMSDILLTRDGPRLLADTSDRNGIWRGEPVTPSLVPAGEFTQIQGVGPWRGPLVVLTDRGTGSAAEDFVAWLKINGIATVLGAVTAGAGGGYVDGGTRTQFRASPFDVRMPLPKPPRCLRPSVADR